MKVAHLALGWGIFLAVAVAGAAIPGPQDCLAEWICWLRFSFRLG